MFLNRNILFEQMLFIFIYCNILQVEVPEVAFHIYIFVKQMFFILILIFICNISQVSVPEVDLQELKKEESKRAAANIRRRLDLENTR